MKRNQEYLEPNQMQVPLTVFLRDYNKNIPKGFPLATAAALKEYQTTHQALFKHNDMWSIDQHRKRVMDWLS